MQGQIRLEHPPVGYPLKGGQFGFVGQAAAIGSDACYTERQALGSEAAVATDLIMDDVGLKRSFDEDFRSMC